MTEWRVVSIHARRTIEGQAYWWVIWATPLDQLGRTDHWQPEDCFHDPDTDTHTDVWDNFEDLFPREWGDILLLPESAARDYVEFPYEFFGHSPVPARWRYSVLPSAPPPLTLHSQPNRL